MIATLILALHLAGVIPAADAINFLYISGALLLIAEIFVTSMGVIALNGLIALFIAYSLQTGDNALLGVPIDWPFLFGVAFLEVVLIALIVMVHLSIRRKKVTTGTESMIGETGEIMDWKNGKGRILAQGEPWKASGNGSFKKGDSVKIVAVNGLVLRIEK